MTDPQAGQMGLVSGTGSATSSLVIALMDCSSLDSADIVILRPVVLLHYVTTRESCHLTA